MMLMIECLYGLSGQHSNYLLEICCGFLVSTKSIGMTRTILLFLLYTKNILRLDQEMQMRQFGTSQEKRQPIM